MRMRPVPEFKCKAPAVCRLESQRAVIVCRLEKEEDDLRRHIPSHPNSSSKQQQALHALVTTFAQFSSRELVLAAAAAAVANIGGLIEL